MGIKGLSSFIQQNPRLFKPFKLHDTKVVIDGSNLVLSLYVNSKQDFSYGGEYESYYECARRLMSTFLECNIKPFIVFNGGHENNVEKLNASIRKMEDTRKRAGNIASDQNCSYPVFPLLIQDIFYIYSVLYELGIPFANCDYAADGHVAFLGNHYDCPILSSNSDFCIFDVHKGFIQFDSMDTKINSDIGSDGREYKFLNCKIYYIDEFVKDFPGLDKTILPLFGTLIGNEFEERETFRNFFARVQLHREDGHVEIEKLLCWLKNKTLNEAVNEVISHFKEDEQEHIKSDIDNSICRYQINPTSLLFIFDQNINDTRNDLLSNTMLVTPCGAKLPQNFVLKFHQGLLPSIFINIIGLHRVFLQPQVEHMLFESSHTCSSFIRQILYGILVRHDINGTECKNKACLDFIEEYDRFRDGIRMNQVWPKYLETLPKINEVHSISKEQCIAIIAEVLGVNSDFFLHIPENWQLFIGSINYWLHISRCSSKAFIHAVILNLINFGLIRCKHPFSNQERCQRRWPTSNKCTCSAITCIAANVSDSDLCAAGKKLEMFYTTRTSKRNTFLFLEVAHKFSQLQSCLLYITYFNQLMNDCLKNPDPQKCFSGAMLYNLTAAINDCSSPRIFIRDLLGGNLYKLFSRLKLKIYENIPNI